jgi:hypothetical protein
MPRGKQDRRDDLERLRVFRDRAKRVDEAALVQSRVGASLEISWKQGSPVTWASKTPSDELLEPLLVRIRPLLAQGDVTVLGIHKVCERRLENAEMRAFLRDVRAEWIRSQRSGIIGLRIDERDMPPEHVADLMINGHYFHDDEAKRSELLSIVGEAAILTRHVFVDYIYRAVEVVYSTADVVRIGLERDLFGV